MTFSANHPILFIFVGAIIALVLAQSFYFLFKSIKRAKQLGISKETIKKTITSSAIFTIAPAIAILVGVVALSKSLGIALPWLRLSVIGSLSYETIAAERTLEALGLTTATTVTEASGFVTIVCVMSFGIIIGLVLTPILTKRIQGGMSKIERMDKKWSEHFVNAMFLGMISAFLGFVFCDVTALFSGATYGLVPVCVFFVAALTTAVCGILAKKCKLRFLTDYALPLSLIIGMTAAIPLTAWLGKAPAETEKAVEEAALLLPALQEMI